MPRVLPAELTAALESGSFEPVIRVYYWLNAYSIQVCQVVRYKQSLTHLSADFYLNFLHPNEHPVSLLELPDLNSVNGRRGVYEFFASDPSLLARTLKPRPELWRSRLPSWTPSGPRAHRTQGAGPCPR